MAQRRLHGLQRVLGVNAHFSTAYGNVGSSISYARGLVAALALGLTPIRFILAIVSLPPKRSNALFGPTLGTVPAERPCRVNMQTTAGGDTRPRQAATV